MKIETIQEIIELAEKFDLAELEVEEKNQKLRLRRYAEGASAYPISSQAKPSVPHHDSQLAEAVNSASSQPDNAVYIKSPMVGTFYRSPSPESEAFVHQGSLVETTTIVCIIEAMKVMNEIQAETHGKIVEVLVENGESVDFGRPLFRIEAP